MSASRCIIVIGAAALLLPAGGSAQDFRFGTPTGAFGFRVGFDAPRASSDIFDETRKRFTVDENDFSGVTFAGQVGLRATSRTEVLLELGYSEGLTASEMRHFVESDDVPIRQETRFRRLPISGSLKAYLLPTGRGIGDYAWVPAKWAPYVGAGGGAVNYRFRQTGDFVVESDPDLPIFTDDLSSSGWAPLAHGFTGVEMSPSPHARFSLEARYSWSKGEMGGDYAGFDSIDLAGFQTTLGVGFRF